MPIYEYQCQACGKRSEALQKMTDPPLAHCEACGGELKRLLSSPAVQFKGSGWYVTDYARRGGGDKGGAKADGKSEAGAESGAGKSEAAKSEGTAAPTPSSPPPAKTD